MRGHLSLADVLRLVQHHSRMSQGKIALLIFCGVPLCFLGPCAATNVVWVVWANLNRSMLPLGTLFWTLSAVLIPLLLLHQRRHRQTATEGLLDRPPVMRLGLFPIALRQTQVIARRLHRADPRNFAAPFTDFFLCGPRLLFDAWEEFDASRKLQSADPLRAEYIIAKLVDRGEGIEIGDLIGGDEQKADLVVTLAWLVHHEIVGINETCDRVWLRTEAKEWLDRAAARNAESEQ